MSNAQDSLRHAIELLAWKDIGSNHSRLKQAIINIFHCIELLLKERLRQIHPAFMWANVDKYPSLESNTVNVIAAITRLEQIGGVKLSSTDAKNLESLRKTRNAIEHYEWEAKEKEVKVIVGSALSFIFTFATQELNTDLSLEFKKDDTWNSLIYELYEFAREYGDRLETKLREQGDYTLCCDVCGKLTVPSDSGSCELCGHWQDINDET